MLNIGFIRLRLARGQKTNDYFMLAITALVVLAFIYIEQFYFQFLMWWRVLIMSGLTIWLLYCATQKVLYIIAASLTVAGSFLPWWCSGDVVIACTSGIDFYNIYLIAYLKHIGLFNSYYSSNNVGIAVVILSILTVWFAMRPPKFIPEPKTLALVSSTLLVLFVSYQLTNHFLFRIEHLRTTLAVFLEYGFVLVLFGSLLLLSATLQDNKLRRVSIIVRWLSVVIILLLPFSFLLERFYYRFIYTR
jgi:hypothetical protein